MTVQSNNRRKLLGTMLALGGAVIALVGLAYLFLTPKSYQATVRLKVTDWGAAANVDNPTDLGIVIAQCDLIRSTDVIDQVIHNLNLIEIWGNRLKRADAFRTNDAREFLWSHTVIQPVPNSSLIEIRAASEERDEPARIANELARVYLEIRQSQRAGLIQDKLGALKQQWDAQSEKVRLAQASLDTLYFEIVHARATNQTRLYDSDSYDLLMAKRVQLESDYITQQNQLAGFKKMDAEELKQVLSSLDTNSPLNPVLRQLNQANSGLIAARGDHGDDSPEAKDATLVVAQLNKRIDQLVAADLAVKEADVAGLKSTLDGLNDRIKNGSTNLAQSAAQDKSYQQALAELKQLKDQRDELQDKMGSEESKEAIHPSSVTAEIIDAAEPPSKPFVPDGKVAGATIASGAFLALAGLAMLLAGLRPPPEPRKS